MFAANDKLDIAQVQYVLLKGYLHDVAEKA